ncbi:type IV pilus modification PilV family protein [Anaerosolibacter sp.]|uniref:type IV pilus modification PilV family protein n=1 Tax=Anaerosolibacter sp. TaxID=1872527 RepID=UPI0039EE06DA
MLKWIGNEKGITLLEIIISMAILGIIITPLSNLFVGAVRINAMAKDQMEANQYAQEYMERLKGEDPIPMERNQPILDTDYWVITRRWEVGDYGMSETNNDDAISYHAEIDFTNLGVSNGEILTIMVTDSQISMADAAPVHLFGGSNEPVNVKIKCNNDNNYIINIQNNSSRRVNLYKVYSNTSKTKVSVNVLNGVVYVYENIFDDTVEIDHKNRLYKLQVIVTKHGRNLAELVSFHTID